MRKKLFIITFVLSFIVSLKGFIVSFIFLILNGAILLSFYFYKYFFNREKIKMRSLLVILICVFGLFLGSMSLFFFTKYRANSIVNKIEDYYTHYKTFPKEISKKKNVVYHLVKNADGEYYFLYYYVNGEYYHQYDGKRNLWFYTR